MKAESEFPEKNGDGEFHDRIEAARLYGCPTCGGDLREPNHVCDLTDIPDSEIPF